MTGRLLLLTAILIGTYAFMLATGHAQQSDPAVDLQFEWALHSRTRDSLADKIRAVIEDRARLRDQVHRTENLGWIITNCRDEGCW